MAERPEDLNLPNAVINKIIKDALPDGVNVSKDARLAISKAASVFVLYATSCANNFSMQHKRKTISGQDVLEAMKEMEFERFVEPLKKSLELYKEQRSRKDPSESRKKDKDSSPSKGELENVAEAEADAELDEHAAEEDNSEDIESAA